MRTDGAQLPCAQWQQGGFSNAGPATNFLVHFLAVIARLPKRPKSAGFEGLDDRFFLSGYAGPSKAFIRPDRKTI
jgi:hypothetical protein